MKIPPRRPWRWVKTRTGLDHRGFRPPHFDDTMNTIDKSDEAKTIVTELTSAFCVKPDAIQFHAGHFPAMYGMKLTVSGADMKRIIGPGGTHIRALQTILRLGDTDSLNYRLKVLEPTDGQATFQKAYRDDPNWDGDRWRAWTDCAAKFAAEHPEDVSVDSQDDASGTMFAIQWGANESPQRLSEFREAMVILINAIGKSTGRDLQVAVVKEPPQPRVNTGRFTD